MLVPGRQKHLALLAQHMVRQRLVRARGYAGAFQRHLDLEVLCEALGRLLRHEWEDGYLIYQLVVENTDPAAVAAECGTSRLTGSTSRAASGLVDLMGLPRAPARPPGWHGTPVRLVVGPEPAPQGRLLVPANERAGGGADGRCVP